MTDKNQTVSMDKIVSLAKRRGFIYPGSDIYGGLGGTWDYGPLGIELKNNIKKAFWQSMVYAREDVVGIDAAILMNPKVWEASGHVEAFTDPLVECKICHTRLRADQPEEIKNHEITHKGKKVEWTQPRQFNLLMYTYLGSIDLEKEAAQAVTSTFIDKTMAQMSAMNLKKSIDSRVYLRGEITQGVHVNFKNILDSTHLKVPFGVAQIGKAFRNEITPGNFTFRSREFEQMELQFYIKPQKDQSDKWYPYWKEERLKWYIALGMTKANLRLRQHEEDERAHYAQDAWDIEYNSPFGWKEFEGIHHRGDWDLRRHQEYSGVDMSYFDQETNQKFLPFIIETSGGVDRATLFFLIDAYCEEEKRVVLKLHPKLAPYKAAVFPLLANKPDLVKKAQDIYKDLKSKIQLPIAWDDRGNIGKRYFAQDEIGTPYCITIDFQTLEDNTVTIRDRDTTKQERIKIEDLGKKLREKIAEV